MTGATSNRPLVRTDAARAVERLVPLPEHRRVLVCLGASDASIAALHHGIAAANALDAELVLLRVLETEPDKTGPTDPVTWDLRRRETVAHVEELARSALDKVRSAHAELAEGRAADKVCECLHDQSVALTVLCSTEGRERGRGGLGNTARQVFEKAGGSIMLVPPGHELSSPVRYRRIMLPLDGSPRAESALPTAIRMAETHGADLVLVHVVPEPELTEIGPLAADTRELRERLLMRNEAVAQSYLERIRGNLADRQLPVRILIMKGGDVRHLVARAVTRVEADLVVMSARGHGSPPDLTAGKVATYMASHATVPLLLVRDRVAEGRRYGPEFGGPARGRLPSRAIQ